MWWLRSQGFAAAWGHSGELIMANLRSCKWNGTERQLETDVPGGRDRRERGSKSSRSGVAWGRKPAVQPGNTLG